MNITWRILYDLKNKLSTYEKELLKKSLQQKDWDVDIEYFSDGYGLSKNKQG
ncbi:MAG: hypothetical protein H0X63_05235 [Flavobacteriales bacterium]|nr:hypothetical protein [Flavobacteriales bacterium]